MKYYLLKKWYRYVLYADRVKVMNNKHFREYQAYIHMNALESSKVGENLSLTSQNKIKSVSLSLTKNLLTMFGYIDEVVIHDMNCHYFRNWMMTRQEIPWNLLE